MNFKVLGIAGGNGVILHPFYDKLVGNVEIRRVFRTPDDIQWRLNFPKIPLDKEMVEYSKNLAQVIVGAPDCGHSSVLSYSRAKKLGNPHDNDSLNSFLASILYYEPDLFLMENLPKLLDNWSDYKLFEEQYHLIKLIKPVSYWGNSQFSRVRLVMVGVKKNFKLSAKVLNLVDIEPTFSKFKNTGELLEGLKYPNESLCHIREAEGFRIPLYYKDKRNVTVNEARQLWNTEFKNLKKWPVNNGRLKNQPGIYRNLEDSYPLTVRKQNRQFNPDGTIITPRQIARIQGIPDSFKLWFDGKNINYSLNKARVTTAKSPPYEIGVWFNNLLNEI